MTGRGRVSHCMGRDTDPRAGLPVPCPPRRTWWRSLRRIAPREHSPSRAARRWDRARHPSFRINHQHRPSRPGHALSARARWIARDLSRSSPRPADSTPRSHVRTSSACLSPSVGGAWRARQSLARSILSERKDFQTRGGPDPNLRWRARLPCNS